nr:MAG TPA: protein of unknown function DUF2303 [Caudoviricetes sp.]
MENIETLINRSEVITDHLNKIVHDGAHVIALPDGFSLASLEQYEAQRYYPRGYYSTRDYRDLLAYAAAREADFTGAAMYIDPEDMVARIIFDYDGGRGHGKNTASCDAAATPLYHALGRICGGITSQKELVQLLEDWAGDISAHDKDGAEIPLNTAVSLLSSLTVEKAKRIKQTQGDWEHERTVAEQAALKAEGQMVAELRITDELYTGTEEKITVRARLSLVVADDKFALNLRLVGEEKHNREKAQEMRVMAENALQMPVYNGYYDSK